MPREDYALDGTSFQDGLYPPTSDASDDAFGTSDASEVDEFGEPINVSYEFDVESPPDAGTSGTTATATPTAASTSAPPTTAPQQTAGEKATDERLNAQCILIDFISNLAELNFNWRASQDNQNSIDTENGACGGGGPYNPYMIAMYGDGEVFSSLINGSEKKSRFLDFTTAQLSSITPVVRLYKVQQLDDGTNLDYLIPFSTHAGWANGLSTSGRVWDANQNSAPIITNQFGPLISDAPINVGLKSFDWQFEGSNPVSSKVDIKAKLVLFAKSLNDIVEPFNIYSIKPDSSSGEYDAITFRYADLILRGGKKFTDARQYDPRYYRIKIQVGWKTENTSLFSNEQIESLKANTSTLILTLIDHKFDFDQDGSLKLEINYRAYFESIMANEDGDFLRTPEQQHEIDEKRVKLHNLNAILSADPESSDGPTEQEIDNAKQEYEQLTKEYESRIDELNKESFRSIIESLQARKAIYYIQVNNEEYSQLRDNVLQYGATALESNTIINRQPNPSEIAKAAQEAVAEADRENKSNDKLNNLVPENIEGKYNLAFFYLGDLFALAINRMYQKMRTGIYIDPDGTIIQESYQDVDLPRFIFGNALYKDIANPSVLRYVNVLDVPVSVEWFTEWFVNEVISQGRDVYPLLYFIRSLSSKLINDLLSNRCDTSNALKNRNRLNSINFTIYKFESYENDLDSDALGIEKSINNYIDFTAQQVGQIANQFAPEYGDVSNLQEYVAIYCQDRRAPDKVDCEKDFEEGRYHFYFGRDRGIVKKITFNRTQVTGLRELNYARESSGLGLEQLMTPYDLDIIMVGNNLMYNGMMIYVNPSGFGRKIGQPDDPESVSFKLKLGGYHLVYRVENILGLDGFETRVKARWVGSGNSSALVKNNGTDKGTIYGAASSPLRDK